MGDFALQAGDLSALEREQNEGEQHEPAEQGDGENESAGIPKGRGAEHLHVLERAEEERGAVGLGAEAFVRGGGLDEADAGELAGGAELEPRRVFFQKEGADGGAAGGEAQLVAVGGAEEVVQHGGRGELDEVGIVRAVLKLTQGDAGGGWRLGGLAAEHLRIGQRGAEACHDRKAGDLGEIAREEGWGGGEMNGDGRGKRGLRWLVVFDLSRRWWRGDIAQEDAAILKRGQHGAANAGTVMRLVRRAKAQQRGDGDDGQRLGRGGALREGDIAPVGDTQIGKHELAAVIDATGGKSGDAQSGIDERWRGLQRCINPHLDDTTAHGEAQQGAIFIQRRQRASKPLDEHSLIVKAPGGEIVVDRRNRCRG